MISTTVSANTQAILLLTATLRMNGREAEPKQLSTGEYNRLAAALRDRGREPADLLGADAGALVRECAAADQRERLGQLLARGLMLAQALERWQARAIWVLSRSDANYPRRWKARLRESAPPLLFGCGDAAILEAEGLAVVGSRNAAPGAIEYSEAVGRLVASAARVLFSGGAPGVDQAAMRGALAAGGKVGVVLSDGLERSAVQRDHRHALMHGQLVLVCAVDPGAPFHAGNAMQRNKLIYTLAGAALVTAAESGKGGTWTGAIEQLQKVRAVTVFVRPPGPGDDGLAALLSNGALPWPAPRDAVALDSILQGRPQVPAPVERRQDVLPFARDGGSSVVREPGMVAWDAAPPTPSTGVNPARDLFDKVRELLTRIAAPRTVAQVAKDLDVSKAQAKAWLERLVADGVLQRSSRPIRYSRPRQ